MEEKKIGVGSTVSYCQAERGTCSFGKVILIATVEDARNPQLKGKKIAMVEHDPRCYPDFCLLEELHLIEDSPAIKGAVQYGVPNSVPNAIGVINIKPEININPNIDPNKPDVAKMIAMGIEREMNKESLIR